MKQNELKELGKRCKRFREDLGIKQLEVAIDMGVSRALISKFENGNTDSGVILSWYIKRGLKLHEANTER